MKLRHFQLIILLVSITNTTVFAQDIRFGVQAGGGVASAYNYYPDRNEYMDDASLGLPKNYIVPSYSLNLYLSIPLEDEFAIAVEPGIIQKGFLNKVVEDYDLYHNKFCLTYIHAPVLLEYGGFDIPITLSIGPEFGYLFKARLKSNDGTDDDMMYYFRKNRLDVGLQFGVYYTYEEHLDLGLKFGNSFTNLEKLYLTDDLGNVLGSVGKKATYLNAFVRVKL